MLPNNLVVKRPVLAFGTKALILSTVTGVLVFVFDNAKAFECEYTSITSRIINHLCAAELGIAKKITVLICGLLVALLVVSEDYDELDDLDSDPNSIEFDQEYERWMYYALDPDGNLCAAGA